MSGEYYYLNIRIVYGFLDLLIQYMKMNIGAIDFAKLTNPLMKNKLDLKEIDIMVKIVRLSEMKEIKEIIDRNENEREEYGFYLSSSIDELIEYLDNFNAENIIEDENENKNGLIRLVVSYQTLKILNENDAEYEYYYGDEDINEFKSLKKSYAVLFERIYSSVLTCLHILDYAIVEEDE